MPAVSKNNLKTLWIFILVFTCSKPIWDQLFIKWSKIFFRKIVNENFSIELEFLVCWKIGKGSQKL